MRTSANELRQVHHDLHLLDLIVPRLRNTIRSIHALGLSTIDVSNCIFALSILKSRSCLLVEQHRSHFTLLRFGVRVESVFARLIARL